MGKQLHPSEANSEFLIRYVLLLLLLLLLPSIHIIYYYNLENVTYKRFSLFVIFRLYLEEINILFLFIAVVY